MRVPHRGRFILTPGPAIARVQRALSSSAAPADPAAAISSGVAHSRHLFAYISGLDVHRYAARRLGLVLGHGPDVGAGVTPEVVNICRNGHQKSHSIAMRARTGLGGRHKSSFGIAIPTLIQASSTSVARSIRRFPYRLQVSPSQRRARRRAIRPASDVATVIWPL